MAQARDLVWWVTIFYVMQLKYRRINYERAHETCCTRIILGILRT